MPPENKLSPTPNTIPTVPHKPTPLAAAPSPVSVVPSPPPDAVSPPLPAQTLQANPAIPTASQAGVPGATEQLNVPQSLGGQAPPPTMLTLEEQIAQKEAAQKVFVLERMGIEGESKELFSTRKALEEKITPIELEEKLSIEHIAELEKERLDASDPHDARIAETNRWAEEEHRRGIEHRRWQVAEELEVVNQKIHDKELAFKALLAKEAECVAQIARLRIMIQQRDLARELESVAKERVATEADHERFSAEYERLTTLLHDTTMSEEETLGKEEIVEQKSVGVRTLYEEQVLAAERHKLEDARREAERQRWVAEDAIVPAAQTLRHSEEQLIEIKKREAALLKKQKELGA